MLVVTWVFDVFRPRWGSCGAAVGQLWGSCGAAVGQLWGSFEPERRVRVVVLGDASPGNPSHLARLVATNLVRRN